VVYIEVTILYFATSKLETGEITKECYVAISVDAVGGKRSGREYGKYIRRERKSEGKCIGLQITAS
jgi:hypothetical protein